MIIFSDTSALVKRYVSETGSTWVRQITSSRSGNLIFVARITWVEARSAFARRQREGSLTLTDVAQLVQTLRSHFNTQYQVSEIDSTLIETAGQLVERYLLRAYDAVQLAAALRIHDFFKQNQLMFVAADDRLLNIAAAIGLLTDNPNRHP